MVAIIFLDYKRHEYSEKALQSIVVGRYPYLIFKVNKYGIAAAINEGLRQTMNYKYVALCANDIIMPDGWLARLVQYAEAIPETGMCGIHCVEGRGTRDVVNGMEIYRTYAPFGNVLLTRKAIDTVGFFQEEFDPYGMQDSDYGFRLDRSGFVNYYISGMTSQHIGHDVGSNNDYRKMKDEGLAKSGEIWTRLTKQYDESKNYYVQDKIH